MSSASNQFQLIGRIGKDPVLETTKNGKKMLKFSLATTKRSKNRETNEYENKTKWFNLALWENKAEALSKVLKKGLRIVVTGEMEEVPTLIENKKITQLTLRVEDIEILYDSGFGKKEEDETP